MVERYAREQMSSKWTQQARYAAWLEVEKAAVKAWNKLGLIPDEDCEKIVKKCYFFSWKNRRNRGYYKTWFNCI